MSIFPFGRDTKFTLIPRLGDKILVKEDMIDLTIRVENTLRGILFEPIWKWNSIGLEIEIQRSKIPDPTCYTIILDWKREDVSFSDGFQDTLNSRTSIVFKEDSDIDYSDMKEIEISPIYKGDPFKYEDFTKEQLADITALSSSVRITYSSYEEMINDSSPKDEATGVPLRYGQVAAVIDEDNPSENAVYRWTNPGWSMVVLLGDMRAYAKTGGSEKTVKDVEGEIAQLAGVIPVYNVNLSLNLPNQYYTLETAIDAVPLNERKVGLIITFRTDSLSWETYHYVRTAVTDQYWFDIKNWVASNKEVKELNKEVKGLKNAPTFFNVNYAFDQLTENYTLENAISVIPVEIRKMGLVIRFRVGDNMWEEYKYIRSATTDQYWLNVANWEAANWEVVDLRSKIPIYNVNLSLNLPNQYYTLETAIAAIPANERKVGLIITFRIDSLSWETYHYVRSAITDQFWLNKNNWVSEGTSELRNSINNLEKTVHNRLYEPVVERVNFNPDLLIDIEACVDISEYEELFLKHAYYRETTNRLLIAIGDVNSNIIASYDKIIEGLTGHQYLELKSGGMTLFRVLVDVDKLLKTSTQDLGTDIKLNRIIKVNNAGVSGIKLAGKQSYIYEDENNFVTRCKFNGDRNYDIVQWWAYTLQSGEDTIFTFKRIAKFENTSEIPLAFPAHAGGTRLCEQPGDCLLATSLKSSYTSGNHLTSDGKITARTLSKRIFADGIELKAGDQGYADVIEIVVVTEAYDPFVRDENDNPFEQLFVETINYRIEKGNIMPIVTREFKKDCKIHSYGGFASTSGAPEVFFPNGHTQDFIIREPGIGVDEGSPDVSKTLYPRFNRFVQRDPARNFHEAVYLLPEYGIGDHSEIPDDYPMYWTWVSKVYHRVTYEKNFYIGDKQRFAGLYSWFNPVADNDDYLVYSCTYNRCDVLVIDVKRAFSGIIPIPDEFAMKKYDVIQKDDSITSISDLHSDGIDVVTTGLGTIMLGVK